MDKVKGVAKGGWHPKGNDGSRESWRADFKGVNQVVCYRPNCLTFDDLALTVRIQAGWVGHGKKAPQHVDPNAHSSRPLESLRDPDAFGPPPKNVHFHGGAAVSNGVTPDQRRLGAPLSADELHTNQDRERQEERAGRKPAPPPVPFRANLTGLSTANLPKTPVRRPGQKSPVHAPSSSTKPNPSLPPRLPPRQNSPPSTRVPSPPPTYTAATQPQDLPQSQYLNQNALSRLGSAGVSVPGFGIGKSPSSNAPPSNPWRDEPSSNSPSTNPSPVSQINNLASRFSDRSAASPPPTSSASPTASQGTSLAQKQSALRTASAFRNDPSSVSLSDARSTASTANNFHERHGEQVASGWKGANALNKKYDIAGRVNGANGGGNSASASNGLANEATAAFNKPAPPPPPTKRLGGSVASPPPVPLGSKPRE